MIIQIFRPQYLQQFLGFLLLQDGDGIVGIYSEALEDPLTLLSSLPVLPYRGLVLVEYCY